jgi:hypothetical protein
VDESQNSHPILLIGLDATTTTKSITKRVGMRAGSNTMKVDICY